MGIQYATTEILRHDIYTHTKPDLRLWYIIKDPLLKLQYFM